jgi:hypothetical protein
MEAEGYGASLDRVENVWTSMSAMVRQSRAALDIPAPAHAALLRSDLIHRPRQTMVLAMATGVGRIQAGAWIALAAGVFLSLADSRRTATWATSGARTEPRCRRAWITVPAALPGAIKCLGEA